MRTPAPTTAAQGQWVEEHDSEEVEQAAPISVAEQQEAENRPFLECGPIQVEWDYTLRRIKEVAEVIFYSEHVDATESAAIIIRKTEDLDVYGLEHILFDNLLLEPSMRIEDSISIEFTAQWRWRWRKAVRFNSVKVPPVVEGEERSVWSYKFNSVDADE